MKRIVSIILILIMEFIIVVENYNNSVNAAEIFNKNLNKQSTEYFNPFVQYKNYEELVKEIEQQKNNEDSVNYKVNDNLHIVNNKQYVNYNINNTSLNTNDYKFNDNNKNNKYNTYFPTQTIRESNAVNVLDSPRGLRTIATADFIVLVWNSVFGAEKYELEFDGQVIDCGKKNLYVQSDLKDSRLHKYRVRTVNSGVVSEWSNYVSAGLDEGVFDAPQSIISYPTEGAVIVCWNTVVNADSYEVEVDGVVKDNGKSTNYIDRDLDTFKTHTYRVRAKKGTSYTKWSHEVIDSAKEIIKRQDNINISKDKSEKNEVESIYNKDSHEEFKIKNDTKDDKNVTVVNDEEVKTEENSIQTSSNSNVSSAAEIDVSKNIEPKINNSKETKTKKNESKISGLKEFDSKKVNQKTKEVKEPINNEKKIKESLTLAYGKLNNVIKEKKDSDINKAVLNLMALSSNNNLGNNSKTEYNVDVDALKYQIEAYENSSNSWIKFDKNFYIKNDLERIKISPLKKPDNLTTLKYQVYLYDKNTGKGFWQSAKSEGEEAGESGKIITSLKIWINGNPKYSVRYKTYKNMTSENISISSFVSDGQATDNPALNFKGMRYFDFDIIEALPKVNLQVYGEINGSEKWSNSISSDGFVNIANNKISKIKLSSSKKSAGFNIRYQVYIKENSAWQEWRNDGEEAGESGKTITNIRAEVLGAKGYIIRYRLKSLDENNKVSVSNFAINGMEPIQSNNIKSVLGLYFEILKSAPEIGIVTYRDITGKGKEWTVGGGHDLYEDNDNPIHKFILTVKNLPKGVKVKYQVFLKNQNKWQVWKEDGQAAGLADDTFTAIRVMFTNDALGNSIRYKIFSSIHDAPRYSSDYAYDGAVANGSLANKKSICKVDINVYSAKPISDLDLTKNEIVIDRQYEIPEGTTITIPAGKKIIFDKSKTNKLGFLVNGTLNLNGTSANIIKMIYNSANTFAEVGKTGVFNINYVDINIPEMKDTDIFIKNLGKVNIKNSKFKGTNLNGVFLKNDSGNDVVIDNSTISSWQYGAVVNGTGNTTINNSNVSDCTVGILIDDGDAYSTKNKIQINGNTLNKNKIGISVARTGSEGIHKELIISSNVINESISTGIYFSSDKLSNISFVNNCIRNTNKNRENEVVREGYSQINGGPICIQLSLINDDKSVTSEFINSINSKENKNIIESGNNVDAIVLEGGIVTNIELNKGKYKFLFNNIQIDKGGKLLLNEGVSIVIDRSLEINKGSLVINGTKENNVTISALNDTISPLSYHKLATDTNKGFRIKIFKEGILQAINTNFYSGGAESNYTIYCDGTLSMSKCTVDNGVNTGAEGICSVSTAKLYLSEVTVKNCNNGMVIGSGKVIKCDLYNNKSAGIYLDRGNDITISKCSIKNNRFGIYAEYSAGVYNSTLENNTYNMYIKSDSSKKVTLYQNNLRYGDYGIYIEGSTVVDIQLNNIVGNRKYGLFHDENNRINVPNNYWGNPNGPSAWYFYKDYYNKEQSVFKDFGNAINNYKNNIYFSPCVSEEIHGIDIGIDEEKISSEAYKVLSDYAYNLKKTMFGNGVNPASGNYSKTYTDLLMSTKGFDINISRVYSSRNANEGIFGKGWSFYYDSSMIDLKGKYSSINEEGKIVTLPGGVVCTFKKNSDGSYTAIDSINTLNESDGLFILQDKEGTSFTFNKNGLLYEMKNRKNNKLHFSYSGKYINKIYDDAGREYEFVYVSDRVSMIKERISGVATRKISYIYNKDNLLESVKDVNGNVQEHYIYDSTKKLYQIKLDNVVTEEIQYFTSGDDKDKIKTIKNANGLVINYTYDNKKMIVTQTDNLNNTTQMMYDISFNLTYSIDQDGYYNVNKFRLNTSNGLAIKELVSQRDKYGYVTSYKRDERGNIIKKIFSDYSEISYTYDRYNNLIKEIDQSGNKTFYVYDSDGIYLLKIIKPLNGKDDYTSESPKEKFAITSFEYYSKSNNIRYNGLIKKATMPSGTIVEYTYDKLGNKISQVDTLGNVTKFTYNKFGDLISQTDGNGNRTSNVYDNKGKVISKTDALGNVTEYIYDSHDRIIGKIEPNAAGLEDEEGDPILSYTYTYYTSGKVKTKTDSLGNVTEYTYDLYGNKIAEKK